MEIKTDPWQDIALPTSRAQLSAKRVSADIPWDCFWARNSEGSCILLMKYSSEEKLSASSLPKLRGIECKRVFDTGQRKGIITLTLRDTSLRDVFYRLCSDIISAVRRAASETEAVNRILLRMWRWHHLLRGGRDDRLSAEEQKGLIGELIVLDRILLPAIGANNALESWKGPLDGIKDFNIARIAIEAKARSSGSSHQISISSEFQLDRDGLDALFLFVAIIDNGLADSGSGFTITRFAENLRASIESIDPGSIELFESLLGASGFRWEDDYSDSIWIHGSDRIYSVDDSFPRIVPAMLGSGVEHVRYSVSLDGYDSHQITLQYLNTFLMRPDHAD
jgi:hypothetical protein